MGLTLDGTVVIFPKPALFAQWFQELRFYFGHGKTIYDHLHVTIKSGTCDVRASQVPPPQILVNFAECKLNGPSPHAVDHSS